MFATDRLAQLHRELIALVNQPDAPTVLREDTSVLLDSLGRYLPASDADLEIIAAATREAAETAPPAAAKPTPTRKPKTSWMAGEVPPAVDSGGSTPQGKAAEPQPPPVGGPSRQLDLDVQRTGDQFTVTARQPGQEPAARSVRELLAATVEQKLSPLGDLALDFTLAIQRRELEQQHFAAAVYAGKPLLEAAVAFDTPAGAHVAQWFNSLVAWRQQP